MMIHTRAQIIRFPIKKEKKTCTDTSGVKSQVWQAMRALERGNSVAAYKVRKTILSDA